MKPSNLFERGIKSDRLLVGSGLLESVASLLVQLEHG